jgi:hypothetical protein
VVRRQAAEGGRRSRLRRLPGRLPPAGGSRRCRSRTVLPATSSSGPRAIRGKRVRPAASATQRAYGGLTADVLHHTYLPFTADQLREHFAPVLGPGERDRHLRYYLASVEEARR